MQFRITGLLLLGAMALPASGAAQTPPAPPAITRTAVAATKLPTVMDVPLHFKAVSVTLPPGEPLAPEPILIGSSAPVDRPGVVAGPRNTRFLRLVEREIPKLAA